MFILNIAERAVCRTDFVQILSSSYYIGIYEFMGYFL